MRHPQGPQTVTACQTEGQDPCPHTPLHTSFSLDGGRSQDLSRAAQEHGCDRRFCTLTQQHREFYWDKSRMLYLLPYVVLPSKEKERYPHPLDLGASDQPQHCRHRPGGLDAASAPRTTLLLAQPRRQLDPPCCEMGSYRDAVSYG
ncbi:ciliary microtubule inner protein 2C [Aptenodytes patagonicus]|uniref:ciliary microtubule inner protein 2C n=1 Tax=Aptenodytes patagonicus TaxID=9234 RepID=UPI003F9FF03C